MDYDGLGPSALSRWNPQRNLSHFFNTEGQHIPFSEIFRKVSSSISSHETGFPREHWTWTPWHSRKRLVDGTWHDGAQVLCTTYCVKALSFHGVNPKLCVIAVVTALDDLPRVRTPKSQKTSKDHGNVSAAQVCFNDMYILDHPCKWSPKCVELCPGQWPKNLYLTPFKVPLVRAAVIFAVLLENVSMTQMAFLVG